jgi:tetratricopeptide (TPR) repeat protein
LDTQSTIIILSNQGDYLWAGIIQGIRHILNGEAYTLPKLNGTYRVGQALVTEGEEAARALYTDLKESRSDEYDLGGVGGLNTLGRLLLLDGYASEAMSVFRLNVEEYPEAALVWDSLGEGYLSLGDTPGAIASFQRALAIAPDSRLVLEKLRSLEER